MLWIPMYSSMLVFVKRLPLGTGEKVQNEPKTYWKLKYSSSKRPDKGDHGWPVKQTIPGLGILLDHMPCYGVIWVT